MADHTSTAYRAVVATVRVGLTSLLGIDLTVNGTSRVPKGGQVVAHNQVSVLDAFIVSLALAEHCGQRPIVMLRDDLRHIPILGKLLSAGAVFVEDVELPGEFDDDAFTSATQHLYQDHAVVVAPEHVVSPSLELLPLRSGAARLATATDTPLIPAAVFGAQRLFDRQGRFRPRRGLPVTVTFGNPVPLDGLFDYMPAMRRLQFDLEALISQTLTEYPDREEGEQGASWWPQAWGGSAPSLFDTLESTEDMAPSVELWATDAAVAASRRSGGLALSPSAFREQDEAIEPRVWSLDREPPVPAPTPLFARATLPGVAPITSKPTDPAVATAAQANRSGVFVTDVIAIAAFDLPGQPRQVLRGATMNVTGRTLTTRDATSSIRMRVRDLVREGGRSVFWGVVEDDHAVGPVGGQTVVPAGTGLMLAATRKVA